MVRRFTCTDKWEDTWFSELEPDLKLAWMYILDRCDCAGIWKRNFKNLRFHCHSTRTDEEFTEIFRERIIEVNNGKWFIPKFLKFQYPSGLNSNKPAIIGVKKRLIEMGLLNMINELLGNDYLIITNDKPIIKDKDKIKNRNKTKNRFKIKEKKRFIPPTLEDVRNYVFENKYNVDAEKFWKYFDAGSWHDSTGKPVRNWKQKLITWANKDNNNGSDSYKEALKNYIPPEKTPEQEREEEKAVLKWLGEQT